MRKVSNGVRLVENAPRLLSVRRQVIRADAIYFVMSSDFKDLVQDVVDRLSNFLIGDDIDIVENAHGLRELRDLDRIFVERFVQFEALRFDFIQGLVGGQTRKKDRWVYF